MSLAELDTKKNIKVTWLSEGITKEVCIGQSYNPSLQVSARLTCCAKDQLDLLVSKTGTMEDLIQALVKKAKIADEAEGGRIRVYETSSNRFYREPARDQSVLNLNEYTQIFAERIPEEEKAADDNNFIHVFHFQNEVNRVHGVPFKFLLIEVSAFQTPVYCLALHLLLTR